MKRLLATAGLVLALGLGLASAQNITRSIQGAQDPRGPIGWDTSNAMYFPGHINAFGQNTTAPSPSGGAGGNTSCGTTTSNGTVIKFDSTDAAGVVSPQGVGCTVFFGSPFNLAPFCVVTPTVATSGQSAAVTTTTTGFTLASAVSGTAYNYICIGNQ